MAELEMEQAKTAFTLSTDEITTAFLLCGYGEVAAEILNASKRISSEEERVRFAEHTETLLKHRGYWDSERESNLIKEFESFIHTLMRASKRLRCVRGSTVLMLHHVEGDNAFVQTCKGADHSFELVHDVDERTEALHTFYEVEEVNMGESEGFTMEVDFFEMLHEITAEQLDELIEKEVYAGPILQFLKDYRANKLVFDNISFLQTDYAVKNESELLEMQFLLESEEFVWHIHYHDIEEKQEVYAYPVEKREYLGMIIDGLNDWFR
ncbi:hypothetical protein NSQ26_04640 [Bacillus sp. FSL W7-1360]